ncbi:MAG: LPXTG cell wall anchor domain-containing protein, partial [Caldilinea sp.]|nr:LPXTG cell wall anchor domain-containing protein [Caldilinea sp.]
AAEEAAAEATPAPTEEAAEEAPAPETLPMTGSDNGVVGLMLGLIVVVAAGLALAMRRRLA